MEGAAWLLVPSQTGRAQRETGRIGNYRNHQHRDVACPRRQSPYPDGRGEGLTALFHRFVFRDCMAMRPLQWPVATNTALKSL
jgi:hypothetical protein